MSVIHECESVPGDLEQIQNQNKQRGPFGNGSHSVHFTSILENYKNVQKCGKSISIADRSIGLVYCWRFLSFLWASGVLIERVVVVGFVLSSSRPYSLCPSHPPAGRWKEFSWCPIKLEPTIIACMCVNVCWFMTKLIVHPGQCPCSLTTGADQISFGCSRPQGEGNLETKEQNTQLPNGMESHPTTLNVIPYVTPTMYYSCLWVRWRRWSFWFRDLFLLCSLVACARCKLCCWNGRVSVGFISSCSDSCLVLLVWSVYYYYERATAWRRRVSERLVSITVSKWSGQRNEQRGTNVMGSVWSY